MTNELKKTASDLLYLVSCAVHGTAPDITRCEEMDLRAVFELSRRHFLAAAAAYALEQAVELPGYFRDEKLRAIRKQALFNLERAKICSALEQRDIWYMPLKGIVMKNLYPYAPLREMTDNDILCDPQRMPEIRSVMERFGYTSKYEDVSGHDVYTSPEGTIFEMHRSLFSEKEMPVFSAYYADIKERLIRDRGDSCGYHMTDEDFYLYLVCHMFKHYHFSGVGLRSLTDMYVYHCALGDRLDRAYLSAELEKLGLAAYEGGTRTLADKIFRRAPLSDEEELELSYYIESIGHGTVSNVLSHTTDNDDSAGAKLKQGAKLLFPSCDALSVKYPILKRHKVFYPALVVYRPLDSLAHHPKQSLQSFKRIRSFKKKETIGKYNESFKQSDDSEKEE